MFVGRAFQQKFGIPLDTNCDPLLSDLFVFISYEADFVNRFLKKTS